MIKAIRARISGAFLVLFGIVALITSALFPAQASAAVFVSARPAIVMSRPVYVAPRVYMAPRPVYIAPRPVIVARPAIVVAPRPVVVYHSPVLVPYVAPTVTVPADGQAQVPVAVVPVRHPMMDFVYVILLIVVVVGILGTLGYCGCYYVWGLDPFDIWYEPVVVGIGYDYYDGGGLMVDDVGGY